MTIHIKDEEVSRFVGYIGEHNATELIFDIPDRISGCDYYRVAFELEDGRVMRTGEMIEGDTRVKLWQELTLGRVLLATLEGYINNEYIGKGPQATLRFEKAAGGVETEADTDPHGLALEVALNSAARHEHDNKVSVLDRFSRGAEGELLFEGFPVSGQNIPTYESVDDLPILDAPSLAYVGKVETDLTLEVGTTYDRVVLDPRPPELSGSFQVEGTGFLYEATLDGEDSIIGIEIGDEKYIYSWQANMLLDELNEEVVYIPEGWSMWADDFEGGEILVEIPFSYVPKLENQEILSITGDVNIKRYLYGANIIEEFDLYLFNGKKWVKVSGNGGGGGGLPQIYDSYLELPDPTTTPVGTLAYVRKAMDTRFDNNMIIQRDVLVANYFEFKAYSGAENYFYAKTHYNVDHISWVTAELSRRVKERIMFDVTLDDGNEYYVEITHQLEGTYPYIPPNLIFIVNNYTGMLEYVYSFGVPFLDFQKVIEQQGLIVSENSSVPDYIYGWYSATGDFTNFPEIEFILSPAEEPPKFKGAEISYETYDIDKFNATRMVEGLFRYFFSSTPSVPDTVVLNGFVNNGEMWVLNKNL